MKKIIILGLLPLNKAYKERLFMNYFDENLIDYEYWSFYYLYYNQEPVIYERIIQSNEKILKDKNYLKQEMKKLSSNTMIIVEGKLKAEFLDLKKYCLRNNIKIIELRWEAIRIFPRRSVWCQRIKKILFKKEGYKIFYNGLYKTLYKIKEKIWEIEEKKYRDNYIILYAGNKNKDKKSYLNQISIMAEDYEKYIKLGEVKQKKQAVFIDQNLPNHPDFKILGEKTIDAKNYYKKLNILFAKIEKELNLEVIIAAHPKYDKDLNYFNKRKIVYQKTAEEIKKSKLIITSYSTAFGMATIEKKPIIIIKTNDFSELMNNYIKTVEKQLGIKVINIDLEKDLYLPNFLNIKEKKYEKYCEDYLYQKINFENISARDYLLKLIKEGC